MLKQQLFGKWKEEQQKNKIQIKYRKTFIRFNTKDSCTGNITHNTEILQTDTWVMSGGDSFGFKRRSTGVKKPMTGDQKTIIMTIISSKSWYRYSICKKERKK